MKNKEENNSIFKFHVGDALWGNIFKSDSGQKESAIAILKKVPLFKNMRKTEINEIERIIHRRRYKEEETIFYEGEPGVGMYIVQEGSITIFKNKTDDEREQLAELTKGEFFGELALLDESPRSATAVASEDSKVLALFRHDLLELIERKPRLGNKLLFELAHLIGERLKHTNEELQTLWAKMDESKMIT
jgi:CRP-like cAMP-binding protein